MKWQGTIRWVGALLMLWGMASTAAAAVADPSLSVHTQLIIAVDEAADFELIPARNGTHLRVRIARPESAILLPSLDEDDPLVQAVSLSPFGDGTVSQLTITLRERDVRTGAQTLVRPFRIVIDVLREAPPVEAPHVAAIHYTPSPFRFAVGLLPPGPVRAVPVTLPALDKGIAERRFGQAVAAYTDGRLIQAQAGLTDYLQQYPNGRHVADCRFLLAELDYRQAWYRGEAARARATRQYDALGQQYPDHPNAELAYLRLAEVLLASDQLEQADALLTRVTDSYPKGEFARFATLLQGMVALSKNHLRTAATRFKAVRKAGRSDRMASHAAVGLGEALMRMGRYPGAADYFEKSLAHLGGQLKGDPRRLRLMGRALLESERFDDARQVFLTLFNLHPAAFPPGLALSHVADSFRGEGHWELAERGYRTVIDQYEGGEGSLAARISLADLYVNQYRNADRAEAAFRSPAQGPGNAEELATVALELYDQVVQLAPSDVLSEEALYKSATLFEELGDDPAVLDRLYRLVSRYPATHWKGPARELAEEALARQVNFHMAAGEPAQALVVYRRYQEALFAPAMRGWQPLYPLALAHEAVGLTDDAMRHYLSLLGSSAPVDQRARAIYRLGNLYLQQGQPEEALKRFKYYARRYPRGSLRGPVVLGTAEAYVAMGKLTRAADQYRIYIKRYAKGAPLRAARLALIEVYRQQQQWSPMVALYKAVLADDTRAAQKAKAKGGLPPVLAGLTTGSVRLALADLLLAQRRLGPALKSYQTALTEGLDGADKEWAELRVARIQLAMGRAGGRTGLQQLARANAPLLSDVATQMLEARRN